MGAQAFGFTPARFAVFTEGPSDALLLPTLLREATELRSLPYQIVPGISAASLERLEVMRNDTPRVAFVVDGDAGGSDIAKRLRALGVPEANVVGLGKRPGGAGLAVEDLLDADAYATAVNEEPRSWPPGTGAINVATVASQPLRSDRARRTRGSVGRSWTALREVGPDRRGRRCRCRSSGTARRTARLDITYLIGS